MMQVRSWLLSPGRWWARNRPLAISKSPGYTMPKELKRKLAERMPELLEDTKRIDAEILTGFMLNLASLVLLLTNTLLPVAFFVVGFGLIMVSGSRRLYRKVPAWLLAPGMRLAGLFRKEELVIEAAVDVRWPDIPLDIRAEVVDHAKEHQVAAVSLAFWVLLGMFLFIIAEVVQFL